MFFEHGKAVNNAARTIARFLAERQIELSHHEALNLVARLQGFPSHEAAQARLTGQKKGQPQAVKDWEALFQVIACMTDTERRGSITLSEGCDENGEAEFFQAELLLSAKDPSLEAAADGVLEPTDFVLVFGAPAPEDTFSAFKQSAHRIALQAELLSGEGGMYQSAYTAVIQDPFRFLEAFNAQWAVNIEVGDWVVFSPAENGYWNHNFGWVGDRDSATGYASHEVATQVARGVMVDDAEVRFKP